jgi:addiction module HigA family antidote
MTKRSPHPGKVLRERFLDPMGLSAGKVAHAVGVPRTRIERVTTGERGVTADTALRLARFFGTTPNYWMDLQAKFDLDQAMAALGTALRKIEPVQRGARA